MNSLGSSTYSVKQNMNSFWEKNSQETDFNASDIKEIKNLISEIHERGFKIISGYYSVIQKSIKIDGKGKSVDEIFSEIETAQRLWDVIINELQRNRVLTGKATLDSFFLMDTCKKEIFYSPAHNDMLDMIALSANGNVPPKNISEPRHALA